MLSRNNPNKSRPTKSRSTHKTKAKRQNKLRSTRNTPSTVSVPRTSQAIRKAAPVSAKKARKLETKKLHARNRAIEEALKESEVEMRDVGSKDKKDHEIGEAALEKALQGGEVEMEDI